MCTTRKDLRYLHYHFDRKAGVTVSKFFERGVLDSFRCKKVKCTQTAEPVTFIHDDVSLLLEFEKKKTLSPESLSSIVESMNVSGNSSQLDSLRSKLSDEQLVAFVKSRHIQSASEMLAWCRYLNNMAENEFSKFADDLNSRIPKPEEPEKIQKVEVVNSPKSE